MIRLRNIRTFVAVACMISFLGVYMVRTVCIAEDLIPSDSHSVLNSGRTTSGQEDLHQHQHHSPGDEDDCCTDVTAKYFASFQSTLPYITAPVLIPSFTAYVTEQTFFQLRDNHLYRSTADIREGPPLPFTTGAGIRIMIQSFLH